jgi:hypothetical protein
MGHADSREAMRAYLEHRPPHWTGKPVDPTAPG